MEKADKGAKSIADLFGRRLGRHAKFLIKRYFCRAAGRNHERSEIVNLRLTVPERLAPSQLCRERGRSSKLPDCCCYSGRKRRWVTLRAQSFPVFSPVV